MSCVRFEFVVRGGRETGRPITLVSGQALTFGRLKSCDVQLDDEAVSRRHCTLRATDHVCAIEDLQSANGTFLNERRVGTASLQPGDVLRVGATEVQFVSAASDSRKSHPVANTAFTLTADDTAPPLVRKAIDPTRLGFLTDVLEHTDDRAVLASTQRYLSTLHRLSDVLSRAASVEALFDSILSEILSVTKGDRAAILMRDSSRATARDSVDVVAVRTQHGIAAAGNIVLSSTVVRDVLEHGISTFTHDALTDGRYRIGDSVVRERIRSVMCAPMRTTDEILGVLYVDSHSAHEFDEAALELLAAIGNHAGVALHRARLLADVENLFFDVTRAIAAMIDVKDGYTHRHSERVSAFAVKLAQQLGVPANGLAAVQLSGLLHDVGKIGVRDAILNKPGELTSDEYAEVKQHPVHGAAILAHIQNAKVAELLPGVKHHHERWDGSGYPDGLAGEDIPLLGRIVAVADYLDALTSDRAYRQGTPLDDAVGMLQQHAGSAFDPKVVEAAVNLHEKGELALPVAPGPALR
jgi:HD-GYP domain-containing protein (c-di-GMP phosphodiesterase class II)